MIIDSIRLQPFDIDFYVIATENKEEDKDSEKLIGEQAAKIGIKNTFKNSDNREWETAVDTGVLHNRFVAALYVHKKKLNELDLLHELIHIQNWINATYAISIKWGEDEASAVFFEYLMKSALELLKRNCIKVTRPKLTKGIQQ